MLYALYMYNTFATDLSQTRNCALLNFPEVPKSPYLDDSAERGYFIEK
jgi:hypothetical protein